MYKTLRRHAIDNVWCSPQQDNQIIVKAKRVTPPGGELISTTVMTRHLGLPTKDVRYHIYQIGQVHPTIVGLLPRPVDWARPVWKKFSDAVNTLPLFADLYSDKGVHSPLHRSYYRYTEDRALIFAVPQINILGIDLYREAIYLRLYTNAHYESDEANNLTVFTHCDGRLVKTTQDIIDIQTQVNGFRMKEGAVFCYLNGQLVDSLTPLNVKLGDVIEYSYDSSVKSVTELMLPEIRTFNSTLDDQVKYLLHRPKDGNVQEIEYIDDIDLYVMYNKAGVKTGRYIHRNDVENHRMVTHRDHSLSVTSYVHIANGLGSAVSPTPTSQEDYLVRIYVRKSGLKRPLVFENQRIFELYKLNDRLIYDAMTGLGSTIDVWNADTLESCAYTEMMRSSQSMIDIDMIEAAYGYNAITKVIGESPIKTRPYSSRQLATLPVVYHDAATIYEYDEDGKLLGYHHSTERNEWFAMNDNTRLIEPVVGLGSDSPSATYGKNNLYINPKYSHRVYKASLMDGVVQNDWVDITGTSDYEIVDDHLVWKGTAIDYMLQVRTDEKFLAYTLNLNTIAGTLYFDLTEVVDGDHRVMEVPGGHLDLWLNDNSLIHGLDYILHFPRVYINAKEHMVQPAGSSMQKIDIRFYGFCTQDMKIQPPADFGYVEHGYLSNNNRYDIRDDKVLRITVRGALKTRDAMEFSEDHAGIRVVHPLNGSPYQIKEGVIPLRYHTESETYAMQAKSKTIDEVVSQYLTQKLPQAPRGPISAVPQRYQLTSPFFSHIVNDLESGQFDHSLLYEDLEDKEVMEICKPYEPLLKFDPLIESNGLDMRYVVIHPHLLTNHIALDLYSFRFMQKVVKLYGRNKVILSNHLTVKLGG